MSAKNGLFGAYP